MKYVDVIFQNSFNSYTFINNIDLQAGEHALVETATGKYLVVEATRVYELPELTGKKYSEMICKLPPLKTFYR